MSDIENMNNYDSEENESLSDDENDIYDSIDDTEKLDKNTILDNYDIKNYTTFKQQPIASTKLTKYEKANILGIRAQQLANGAKPLIKDTSNYTNVIDIAKQELIEKKLPLIIKRPLCDGTYEYWKTELLH